MAKVDLNWAKIREEFENTPATLQELAEKYNVSPGTVRSRKSREGWEKKVQPAPKKKPATQRTKQQKKSVATLPKNKTNYMTNHLAKSSPITKKGNFAGPRLSKPVSLVAARPAGELTILEPDAANFMGVVPPAQKTFAGIKTPGLTAYMKRLFATA